MRVEQSEASMQDLEEIFEYIANDSRRHAARLLAALQAEIVRIAERPYMYRLRPEIGEDARIAVVQRYAILFWTDGTKVRVERVMQGNRLLEDLIQ